MGSHIGKIDLQSLSNYKFELRLNSFRLQGALLIMVFIIISLAAFYIPD
jgi:hypothetical protein